MNGAGDGGQVLVREGLAYVGHMGRGRIGTSIIDVTDPERPQVVSQLLTPPGTHSHKVQLVDELMLVNYERNRFEPDARSWRGGLRIYDVTDPRNPREVGWFEVAGKGVHRMTCWETPYVYMSASADGFREQFLMIVDISTPTRPQEVGRWWLQGMREGEREHSGWSDQRKYTHHHPIIRDNRAFCSWWDAGLVILDITNAAEPRLVHHLQIDAAESGQTHTALPIPGREILVLVDEAISSDDPVTCTRQIRIIDISDESLPREVSRFPVPEGPYREIGGTFGPHNLHEMRPGSFVSSEVIHATYNNAGLRVYSISDPLAPRELASFVPEKLGGQPALINDVFVETNGRIYITEKSVGGLYILEDSESRY